MSEQLQDLEDYIQYQFDDIPSFKLALFLNSGDVKVKTVMGEVEENFLETLISQLHDSPDAFHLGSREFTKKSEGKLLEYATTTSSESESDSPRVYLVKKYENSLIVYCCGSTVQKDEERVKTLMMELFY